MDEVWCVRGTAGKARLGPERMDEIGSVHGKAGEDWCGMYMERMGPAGKVR